MFQPKVFIIILNYNNWPDTRQCLASLQKIDYGNFQIVVVDNNSIKKERLDSNIILIENQQNLGFAGGNNTGINFALGQRAEYILILNNDTTVDRDFLKHLVKTAQSDQAIAMVGPKIYFHDKPKQLWYAGGQVNWLYNKAVMRGYSEEDKGQYDSEESQETDYISGCCLLIKGNLIDKIGLMPEQYFLYYEDTDWSLKAQDLGYKCVFDHKAKIWHKGSRSTIEASDSYIYYHSRNGLMLAQKYAPPLRKMAVHLDAGWRIIKQIIKLILVPQKRNWAINILKGIKDFYLNKEGKYENWH